MTLTPEQAKAALNSISIATKALTDFVKKVDRALTDFVELLTDDDGKADTVAPNNCSDCGATTYVSNLGRSKLHKTGCRYQ